MVKRVERVEYQTSDGLAFTTEERALAYEAARARVDAIMATLGPRHHAPQGCEYENGGGYVQHDPAVVLAGWRSAVDAACEVNETVRGWREKGKIHNNFNIMAQWVGRVMDGGGDSLDRLLCDAMRRFMCIDSRGREWGQPYFAAHPEEATKQCLRVARGKRGEA